MMMGSGVGKEEGSLRGGDEGTGRLGGVAKGAVRERRDAVVVVKT